VYQERSDPIHSQAPSEIPEPRAMKVLYAITDGEMNGVHRFLGSVFANHSAEVLPVVVSFREGPWLDELRRAGMKVYTIDGARIRQPVRVFRQVRSIIEREKIEIVHSSYSWCHSMVTPAARWSGCKSMWFHHGPIADRRWQGMMSLVPADLLLTNSQFMLNRVSKTFHAAKRTGLVRYGIDAGKLKPDESLRKRFRDRWGLDTSSVAVGIVGFLDVWKGQDVFLKSAKLLADANSQVKMFVVGGPREYKLSAELCQAYERQLHDFAKQNGLSDFVRFTGHVDVRDGVLDGLDVFVHASTEPDPFPSAILEAMAKGKAIIASAEGGPLEMVENGREGYLIEPRRPDTLADAIATLAGDQSKRTEFGAAAMKAVSGRLSASSAVSKLEGFYRELL
jgi:glycosyltransferase involved in cell wall biosynthesis